MARRRKGFEAGMDKEVRFHLERSIENHMASGMSREEARQRALREFGPVALTKEAIRDTGHLRWLRGLSLDLKLAWRVLRKSPGLAVVGALGIALGTGIGVGFFVVLLSNILYPELPLDEGERIVALENWDVEANEEARRSLDDFLTWRGEMRSVERIAAASIGSSPLVTGDAPPQTVRSAAMTAAGFEVARVPTLLGRYLDADDEAEGPRRWPCLATSYGRRTSRAIRASSAARSWWATTRTPWSA